MMELLFLVLSLPLGEVVPASESVKTISPFELRDVLGSTHALQDWSDKPILVVAFLGVECPLAKLYGPRLAQIADKYASQGVQFVAINSNIQDPISKIVQYSKESEIEFPFLKDPGNRIADLFGAKRVPEVFVLDQDRVIRYHGRVDDQFGIGFNRPQPTRHDLREAIEDLLAGKPVRVAKTEAPGCFIGRVREPSTTGSVTYANQISRIFQKRCVECHRPGEVAPFSLTSYEEAIGWGDTIEEVVREERMPPWHANPEYGHFINDSRLTDEEKELLYNWVRDGMPRGEDKDLPSPIEYASGWRIPDPDVVLELPTVQEIPATGRVNYRHILVDPGFTEDKWIQFAEARPGNREVVHHILVIVLPPGRGSETEAGVLQSDWLTAFAPGSRPLICSEGMAKFVPAGSQFILQMHYTPNGKATTDRSMLGLVFADPKTVRKEVATDKAWNQRFLIPPHAKNFKITSNKVFRKDTMLLAMMPHTHLRGKAFRYEVRYPDGSEEILLDVPNYDFDWQNTYAFVEPKLLPKGTEMICTAYYDNSAENPNNPDPTQRVRFGEQTWEEMMIGYFDCALVDQDLLDEDRLTRTEQFLALQREDAELLSEQLRNLARDARSSRGAFNDFVMRLTDIVPQIDWVMISAVGTDDAFVMDAASDTAFGELNGLRRMRSFVGMALPRYAKLGKIIQHPSLEKAGGLEMQLMKRLFSSSVHIPVTVDGMPATVNFWSKEANAFPPEAIELLQDVAELLVKEDRRGDRS